MKTYKDIIKTQKELINDGYTIENAMLESIDIDVFKRFGGVTTLNMITNCCVIFGGYNMDVILSEAIKCIVDILNLNKNESIGIADIKNVPIRIVSHGLGSKVAGFGDFLSDKFVLVEDVTALALENVKERVKNV